MPTTTTNATPQSAFDGLLVSMSNALSTAITNAVAPSQPVAPPPAPAQTNQNVTQGFLSSLGLGSMVGGGALLLVAVGIGAYIIMKK